MGPANPEPAMTVVVAEGLGATWFYHLRDAHASDAFCGAGTFAKDLPVRLWGFVGHLGERYCRACGTDPRAAAVLPQVTP
jgi:hypothetical protein